MICHDTGGVLARLLPLMANHEIGQLMIGTTKIDPGDRMEEDLAAVSDLVAGASAEFLTAMVSKCGKVPSVPLEFENRLTTKTEMFFDWFCQPGHRLKRLGIVFDEHPPGRKRIGTWGVTNPTVVTPRLYLA